LGKAFEAARGRDGSHPRWRNRFGYCWLGVRNDSIAWVHQHEQFHFYFGAKYQKEVGWFDLYKASDHGRPRDAST
jgi:hypothetical protein